MSTKFSSCQTEFSFSLVSFCLVSRPHVVRHIFHWGGDSHWFIMLICSWNDLPWLAGWARHFPALHSVFVFSYHGIMKTAASRLPPTKFSWPILFFCCCFSCGGKKAFLGWTIHWNVSRLHRVPKDLRTPPSLGDWHVDIRHKAAFHIILWCDNNIIQLQLSQMPFSNGGLWSISYWYYIL